MRSIKRETPRRKAVASQPVLRLFCSRERETPRRKAVASLCWRHYQLSAIADWAAKSFWAKAPD
jgi:hypothetical protein